MTKETYKRRFAQIVATGFRESFTDQYRVSGESGPFDENEVYAGLEAPKDPRLGWFAFPVFRFVPLLKRKPAEISELVGRSIADSARARSESDGLACTAVGGYLNGQVSGELLARSTLKDLFSSGSTFGTTAFGSGKTCLVEYSSPNIAKPFGVGHLRSTVIGNSLRRIFRKLGYTVVGINYPGDWGTQFGKMIVAYRKWGKGTDLEGEDAIKRLLNLYVRYHKEAETDPALDESARQEFKHLEDGQSEAVALWEQFKTISHREFDRIYSILGVEFDLVYGESFLNDKMEALVDRLAHVGLTKQSQGALVVELDDPGLPPALLKKADGATLYLTRDLAGAYYRWNEFKFDLSLYVVATSQADHFRQMLQVIRKLEDGEQVAACDRFADRIVHVDFGSIRFGGKMMATRSGNIIFLEDVIDEAVALAEQKIREKNPDLADLKETAKLIGVGAVIFSQLGVRRQRDVDFSWDEVLSFEGETGPYLQYTHARLCSLGRMYGKEIRGSVDESLLSGDEERRVLELVADFPEAIQEAARHYDPSLIAAYLLKLAGAFNKFYQRKDATGRIDKIISDNEALTAARMALVKGVQIVVHEGLDLLGLRAPEEM